ncbi:zinc knuckle CX2CX4HX4C containing protein [Tanacetum coccineum]
MNNTLVPRQVKKLKIQAGVKFQDQENSETSSAFGSALKDLFVLYLYLIEHLFLMLASSPLRLKWKTPTLLWRSISNVRKKNLAGVSLGKVAREKIPDELSPSNYPGPHVARDEYPQQHVAREGVEMSLGIVVNVVVHNETQGGKQVLEPNLTISSLDISERLERNHTGILDSSSRVLPPNSSTSRVSSLPCSQSSICNTPTIPHLPKSSRQVECHPTGKAKSKTKKRNSKEGKRNIQSSSSSIDESSQDDDVGPMAGVDIDTLTMEHYLALSRENQASGMVKPEIEGNVNFEIKTAKRWVDKLAPGTINTWDILKKAFIQRYCPPSMTAKQLKDIYNFKQEGDESLYEACERMTTRNVGNNSSSDGLAALVNKLDNLGRDMKKLKESVHAIQEVKQVEEVRYQEFGRIAPFNINNGGKFRVGPPGYYTETDNRPPYGERRKSLEELLAKHQEESA